MSSGQAGDELLDDSFFMDEEEEAAIFNGHEKWKLLIVDDDEEVHSVTKLVLKSFSFAGRSFGFYHAYSGDEAIKILEKNPDIALILLDVVMEEDDAGLVVVKKIREEMRNLSFQRS